jgi:hypothetical protein
MGVNLLRRMIAEVDRGGDRPGARPCAPWWVLACHRRLRKKSLGGDAFAVRYIPFLSQQHHDNLREVVAGSVCGR